jgi:hypothetical protein
MTKIIVLGTIDTENGEAVIIPPGLDPDEIKAAIEVANRAKFEAAAQETKRLRDMFLTDGKTDEDKKSDE